MEFEGSTLIFGFIASLAGLALFRFGKKAGRLPQLAVGLVLLVVPYFLPNALSIVLTTLALFGLLWLALRWGY